jgi:excisionase family DNA binding protein
MPDDPFDHIPRTIKFLSVGQVAEVFNLAPATIRRLCAADKLRHQKVGKPIRIYRTSAVFRYHHGWEADEPTPDIDERRIAA